MVAGFLSWADIVAQSEAILLESKAFAYESYIWRAFVSALKIDPADNCSNSRCKWNVSDCRGNRHWIVNFCILFTLAVLLFDRLIACIYPLRHRAAFSCTEAVIILLLSPGFLAYHLQ